MGDLDLTEALAAGESMARAWSEYPASTVAAQAIHAATPLIVAQVRAQIASELDALATDETDDAGWIAYRHAADVARGDS